MENKKIPLEPEAQIAFACIISFIVILFVFGIYGRCKKNKIAEGNDMPDQVVRIKLNTTPKRDTVVSVPFKFYRVK